ncbi:Beta-lactamase/transpeptidase-like [Lasallia pustulata]|uniref:Beta-lactamase/transpeptidase-like n=1 Tax=Lasallia pustulata TaxID=136370 RepID=A0A1W5DC65_9LECA|nr:Beta-lactamase/transpeptidase-like [Lasallia pustulata]
MVRRASDGIKLGEYMQKHIWGPLDMTSITFHLEERPDVEARLSDMSIRTPTGDLAFIPGHLIEDPVRDDLGGGGSYSSAPDYLKVLASILRNDGQLLQTQTVHEMFKPQLSPQAKEMFQKVLTTPEVNDGMTGGVKIGTSVNWGLGGFLVEEDTDGGRRKGSLAWVGMPNLYWWVDRETDICALYATQVVPPGDTKTLNFVHAFEREMTKRAAGMSKGKI